MQADWRRSFTYGRAPNAITYLVSSRPYIEICLVCKVYGRRGGAEPSIYFTNPTYFYAWSGTDQISVLFCRGPLFVYVLVILRKDHGLSDIVSNEGSVCVCIGVLRHMQHYFSYICDGTDVQADWKRSFTYGRAPNAITYLVSYRPYIEICLVCKVYGRRGGAEPSIYFTNPTYFYAWSGTDQISVLFCRGPLFVFAVLRKIRKFIRTTDKLTSSLFGAKMWRRVVRDIVRIEC